MSKKHNIMNTAKPITYFLLGAIFVVGVIYPDKLGWKITLPSIIAFITWMIYELDNALEINDDEMRSDGY